MIGGSRGALALNKFVPEAIKNLSDNCPLEIWHQTGENHLEFTRSLYAQNKIAAKVDAFIDNIIEAYQWADVIVCRAGALTVAELTAVGVASILVPFPYATDDHQTLNARYLTEANAGVLLPHTELQNQKLLPILQTFLDDREKTQQMAISARKLANMDALEKITRKMEIMLS